MRWNEEQSQLVKDLWPTHSAGAIVRRIAQYCHEPITRNAIIGKAYRLHLTHSRDSKGSGRAPVTNMRPAKKPDLEKVVRKRIRPTPAPPPEPFSDNAPLATQPCALIELDNNRCRWPLGPIEQCATLFCGAAAIDGRPYCLHHCGRAYHPR